MTEDIRELFIEDPGLWVMLDADTDAHPVGNLSYTMDIDISVGNDIIAQVENPTEMIPIDELTPAIVGKDHWRMGLIVSTRKGRALVGEFSMEDSRGLFDRVVTGEQIEVFLTDQDGKVLAQRTVKMFDDIEHQRDFLGEEIGQEQMAAKLGQRYG